MSDFDDDDPSEDYDDPSESEFSPSDSDDSRVKKKSKKPVKKAPAKRASSSPTSKKPVAKKKKKSPAKKKPAAKKKATPAKKKASGGAATKKKPAAAKPKKKRQRADSDGDDDDDDGDLLDEEEEVEADDGWSDEEDEDKPKRSGKGKGKGKAKNVATKEKKTSRGSAEVDQILQQVKRLMLESQKEKAVVPTLTELGIKNVREVSDMTPYKVLFEIEKLVVSITESILKGEAFSYTVPTRGAANQLYIPELDRLVLSDKVTERSFLNPREVRKTALTTRALQLVHEVLSKGIHITKRDMFYTDVKLFKQQKESDIVLDDMACMLGCTRSCLNVVASEKGLIVGRVQFEEDGDPIDCTRMGVGGKAIPPFIDKIANIQSDAKFILLVEKEAAYLRIAEDRFYNKYPCIVITGKGQPDVATRVFLKRLKNQLNIPVLGLFDSDPYGLKILSVYMSGSKNMSYDSASLTTPDIKWLGVRPSDLDRYKLPEQCRLDMSETDLNTGRQLLKEEFVQKNPEWVKELELMMKTKKKAEIQALSAFGFQYITEDYLPRKLEKGDWI